MARFNVFRKFYNYLKRFFYYLWNFRSDRKISSIEKTLAAELRKREKERGELLKELRPYLRKFCRFDERNSRYIPVEGRNPAEVYGIVRKQYGEELDRLSIRLTRDLTLKL